MALQRGRPNASKFCAVRDNERLHTLIVVKFNQKGLNYSDLARDLGVSPSNVRKYILFRDHSISQQKVLLMAANLGISVDLKIEVYE